MAIALALNLAASFRRMNRFEPITKADIAPQDLSYFDDKLTKVKKMMKKHPGKNRDWDPEAKTIELAQIPDIKLTKGISRQVDRQIERMNAKASKKHKGPQVVSLSFPEMGYNERIIKIKNPETGMIKYGVVAIKRPTVTHVNTSRYKPHIGQGVRYSPNFKRSAV